MLVAESAKAQGIRVVAVAHHGETEPALEGKVEKVVWVKLGQLGQVIKALKGNGVTEAVMAGTITKTKMFTNARPDLRGLSLMTRIAIFHDDDILRAVAEELRREGIQIVSSIQFLPGLAASGGVLTRRRPTKEEREDIRFGWAMAKELGRLDIGQCIVVRKKTVVAVEAMEGTDETILRGGALAREKAVVIKVSKPHQDLRFDIPSVGLQTIEVMAKVKKPHQDLRFDVPSVGPKTIQVMAKVRPRSWLWRRGRPFSLIKQR